jgi:hypothetical protein
VTTDPLVATASGSTDADGDPITYEYEWARSLDGGVTWQAWGNPGSTLPASQTTKGEVWKARARASDGTAQSAWVESNTLTILNSAPAAPTSVVATPASPVTTNPLTAAASGSTDADGDAITYQYEWAQSLDGGVSWQAWGNAGATLPASQTTKGEVWKAHARASDGTAQSAWVESNTLTILNSTPTTPTSVVVTPGSPVTTDPLTATPAGSTDADGDPITYEAQWSRSLDGGATWQAWGNDGSPLPASQTTKGERWKAHALAFDGTARSGWSADSASVLIGNSPPDAPTSVIISPSAPTTESTLSASASGSTDADGDAIQSHQYRWASSADNGTTWSGWTVADTRPPGTAHKGELWKAQARASDGTAYGPWSADSAPVTIQNALPTKPTSLNITPNPPADTDDLTGTAGGSTDPDGDGIAYQIQWQRGTDGGTTWGAWGNDGSPLPAAATTWNDRWRARARAFDGTDYSGGWFTSSTVTINTAPTPPTSVTIAPGIPDTLDSLTATVTGSTDVDAGAGDSITTEVQWSVSTGGPWSTWGNPGAVLDHSLTTRDEQWKARGRAVDQAGGASAWVESTPVTIANSTPSVPTSCSITPGTPLTSDTLTGGGSGSTDDDPGDTVTYQFQWSVSLDGGTTWGPWGNDGPTLAPAFTTKGELWKAHCRATDGTAQSGYGPDSAPVTIANSAPSAPTSVAVAPTRPADGDDLVATATGHADADGDAMTLEYEWARSLDGGTTWGPWGNPAATLPAAQTSRGDWWKAHARATDGTDPGPWTQSTPVLVNSVPTAPTAVDVTPGAPNTDDTLTATASGSTDADGDPITYSHEWSRSTNGGATWDGWGNPGPTLPPSQTTKGDWWKARSRAFDGLERSGWVASDPVVIGNSAPSVPTSATIAPTNPLDGDNLTATVTGATDADGDALTYNVEWSKSTDGGTTWGAWGNAGATLPAAQTTPGDLWKAHGRANDGAATGPWLESAPVRVNAPPTSPPTIDVTPAAPTNADSLVAAASGSTDVDGDFTDVPDSYEYEWCRSQDGGATWGAWQALGRTLDASQTSRDDQWKVRARAYDGTDYSGWTTRDPVVIGNALPTQPVVDVTPDVPKTADDLVCAVTGNSTDPDGDPITYKYRWQKDGVPQAAYNDATTVPASATAKGELWKCVVTPNDGRGDGPSGEDQVVIANTAPTAPVVGVTPAAPKTADNLTGAVTGNSTDADADPVTYQFRWQKDGVPQAAYDGATTVPASATAKGEVWTCVVTPNDGSEDGASGQGQATIVNSAPTQPVVDVTPNQPRSTQDLTGAVTGGGTDPDGDTVAYGYRWFKDGVQQSAYDDATTIPASATEKGEVWRCVVTPNDGQDDGPSGQDQVRVNDPAVRWAGTAGYETDGVAPDSGIPDSTPFTFKVKYTDPTGAAPVFSRCFVRKRVGKEWRNHKTVALTRESGDITTGAIYSGTTLLGNETLMYRFEFQAPDGMVATGAPASTRQGPLLAGAPKLWWRGTPAYMTDGVSPDTGSPSRSFTFGVLYTDSEGDVPTVRRLVIRKNGTDLIYKPLTASGPGDHRTGKPYSASLAINEVCTLEYRFDLADNDGTATGTPTQWQTGPTIDGGADAAATAGTVTAIATRTGAQITLSLPSAAHVTATVTNMAGRPVRTVVADRPLGAGLQTLLWDRRNDAGLTVPAGLYVVQLVVRTDDGRQSTTVAPVTLP